MRRRALLIALGLTILPLSAAAQRSPVILSTTTSTQDSGLLDVLVPRFERQTGYSVKTIAVGTGQALALAGRGEADVVLAHASRTARCSTGASSCTTTSSSSGPRRTGRRSRA